MAEFNDDTLALNYIREKGRASYSSIKMVRDCSEPSPYKQTNYYDTGKVVHSLLLEHTLKKVVLQPTDLAMVKLMLQSLCNNSVVKSLLNGSVNEDMFTVFINGLPVLGYIDINGTEALGDLKTTRHTKKKSFVMDMEFLQAAIYMRATGKKHFIYVGISKSPPYEVFTFNVTEYPERLKKAWDEMEYLTKYIKAKL